MGKLLEEIITEVNGYFVSGQFRNAPLGQIISESTITTLIQRNKEVVANSLRTNAIRDSVMDAYIDNWWLGVKSEYAQDESDKYKAYAKTVILNWANRIIFAHIIKYRQNGAMMVDEINYHKTPNEANTIFKRLLKDVIFIMCFRLSNIMNFCLICHGKILLSFQIFCVSMV